MSEERDFQNPDGNGLRHFVRLNAPTMTAAELAKMLEGWPEGVRPFGKVYVWSTVGHAIAEEGGCDEAQALAIDIDLACMSGLRWLKSEPGISQVVVNNPRGGEEVLTIVRPLVGAFGNGCVHYRGPTLLHAIDAAIRAAPHA